MKKIVVAGSINMDIVSNMEKFPIPGQTIYGNGFGTFPGGKGANQAAAAGKLGADVTFLGMVGKDIYGTQALEALEQAGVNTEHIESTESVSTGVAVIHVNEEGENYIVIQEGANGLVDIPYIKRHLEILDTCDVVLLQFEIPLKTVEWIADYCKKKNIQVILDPAPARKCSTSLLECVDYITPNESELRLISQKNERKAGAEMLLNEGVKYVLNKRGARGCYLIDKNGELHVAGFQVDVIDTTAAGDSFNAGFAVALTRGMPPEDALTYANATGALAVTGMGAQSAMPSHEEVCALIDENNRT